MREELREVIATLPFYHEGLRRTAALLPESDAELNEWLEGRVLERDALHFGYGICAAAFAAV